VVADINYGPATPGDDELRLCGELSDGRRAVELGISPWFNSVAFARAGAKSIAVDIATGAQGGELEADPELLEQAVTTFVLEARERLAGGGRIELRCDRIAADELRRRDLAETFDGSAVRITIADDGQPLPAAAANRPFEPFALGQPAERGALGLAAAYGIVRQCGGVVLLAESADAGTSYEVVLPLAAGRVAARPASGEIRLAGPRAPTVLLVEDEDLIRNLAEQILGDAGYRVLPAANGNEAMAIADGLAERIDLLLTDVVMPGVSGTDLAHRLLRRHPEMRILYMSGYSDSLIFRYGVLQERAAFLRKPFSPQLLERRVAELLAAAT